MLNRASRIASTACSSGIRLAMCALPFCDFLATFIERIVAFNRNNPGYLALTLGSTLSSPFALVLTDFHQGLSARLDAILAAYWPQSTGEQRHLSAQTPALAEEQEQRTDPSLFERGCL